MGAFDTAWLGVCDGPQSSEVARRRRVTVASFILRGRSDCREKLDHVSAHNDLSHRWVEANERTDGSALTYWCGLLVSGFS